MFCSNKKMFNLHKASVSILMVSFFCYQRCVLMKDTYTIKLSANFPCLLQDALDMRQLLSPNSSSVGHVKGERLVRYEVNAVISDMSLPY